MKKSPVVITEPAAVAALKKIYETNGPGNLEWDFSIPGQVTALDGRLEARGGALTGLNLNRAGLKGTLKLRGVKTLTVFKDYENDDLYGTYLEDLPGLNEKGKWLRQLGETYDRALFLKHHVAEALKWFRQAAEQGDAEAKFLLGQAYDVGYGVAEDKLEAAKWYRQAAEQGHSESQFRLGRAYDEGLGVEKDKAEAVKWYRLAAEQGHAKAQSNLGLTYDWGQEEAGDKAEAADLPNQKPES